MYIRRNTTRGCYPQTYSARLHTPMERDGVFKQLPNLRRHFRYEGESSNAPPYGKGQTSMPSKTDHPQTPTPRQGMHGIQMQDMRLRHPGDGTHTKSLQTAHTRAPHGCRPGMGQRGFKRRWGRRQHGRQRRPRQRGRTRQGWPADLADYDWTGSRCSGPRQRRPFRRRQRRPDRRAQTKR